MLIPTAGCGAGEHSSTLKGALSGKSTLRRVSVRSVWMVCVEKADGVCVENASELGREREERECAESR